MACSALIGIPTSVHEFGRLKISFSVVVGAVIEIYPKGLDLKGRAIDWTKGREFAGRVDWASGRYAQSFPRG
jgi:hypothetical protein